MIPVLETNRLTKQYTSNRGCTDITLTVGQGRIFGLLGPNGAGKSTFVKMLAGLLAPTSGEASLLGLPLGHVEARRKLGYLPELFRYPDWLTGEEVLNFHARLSGLPKLGLNTRIRETLAEVGLLEGAARRVKHYSKGMQQRLGLACAIVHNPEFVILDEPSSALDPIGRFEVRAILQRLRQKGTTVFLNTHLLEDVQALCDEVAFLHDGKLRASGKLHELLPSGGAWELAVGGWRKQYEVALSQIELPGTKLTVKRTEDDGSAVLMAEVADREQLGWINTQLVELGVILYEVKPQDSGLEHWFMSMTTPEGGGRG